MLDPYPRNKMSKIVFWIATDHFIKVLEGAFLPYLPFSSLIQALYIFFTRVKTDKMSQMKYSPSTIKTDKILEDKR